MPADHVEEAFQIARISLVGAGHHLRFTSLQKPRAACVTKQLAKQGHKDTLLHVELICNVPFSYGQRRRWRLRASYGLSWMHQRPGQVLGVQATV